MEGTCQACGKFGSLDLCHIKSRGSGGDNDQDNVLFMDRSCHKVQHQLGWVRFLERRPLAKRVLFSKGWIVILEFGVRRLKKA
jgi:5-methylcytosine-specific restriction endonuclease McrA